MARRNVRQSRALGTGQSHTLPAPYRGLNLRDNRAALSADQAREMENFFPDLGKLTVRPGFVSHANLAGEDFSLVSLLANFDGTDGDTTSTDESDFNDTLIFSGDAQLDTAQKKFGDSSLLLDGTGDYVRSATSGTNSQYHIGTDQFTLECFIRPASLSGERYIMSTLFESVNSDDGYALSTVGSSILRFEYYKGSFKQTIDGVTSLSTGTWYHVSVDRDSNGIIRLYVDGTMVASNDDPSDIGGNLINFYIGSQHASLSPTERWNGWIDAVRVTKGLARYAGAYTAPTAAFPTETVFGTVRTLAEHKGIAGRTMVAITSDGSAFDASSTDPQELSAAGYVDSRFQTTNFNNYLFGVNGTETPWRFDGSSWLATGFTGATLTDLVNVANVRNRLWFCKNNSADVMYGGIGNVTGALTDFQLSQIASGGRCQAIGSWSRDSGDGADDVTVFIMDTGQIIVYEGDPASTFTLVGKYEAPEPVGRQCTVKVGGELIIITKSGFLPVSQIYSGLGDIAAIDVWGQVASGVEADYARYGTLEGWHGVFHKGVVYFNVPLTASAAKQYILNTRNNHWTTFTRWNAYAFSPFGDDLYFSERAVGTINRVGGATDKGEKITCRARTGFSYPGGASTNQQYTAMRPNITAKGTVQGRMGLDPDFNTRALSGDLLNIVGGSGGTPWGSPWVSAWGATPEPPEKWFSANGRGRSVGVALEIETSASDLAWDSTDVLARPGNAR